MVAMARRSSSIILLFICIATIELSWCVKNSSLHCFENERTALLIFKHSLSDPSNRLSSWAGQDCCGWEGVRCDNRTGHVVKIDLRNPHPFDGDHYDDDKSFDAYSKACLVGKELNPSLLELKDLIHLDLSWNNFSGSRIPNFLGSFRQLRYLNLSSACFNGKIPHELDHHEFFSIFISEKHISTMFIASPIIERLTGIRNNDWSSISTKIGSIITARATFNDSNWKLMGGVLQPDAVTIGEALEATAITVANKPVDRSDAAAIQAAEVRGTGSNVLTPGGVAAAAQSAASLNERLAQDEVKTKLGDVLMDASLKLPAAKEVTRENAEGVIGAELRNNPNMATHPGGVAESMATAARMNQQPQRNI